MKNRVFILALVCSFTFSKQPLARANAIVNGDFATGNLTGWTASAIDFLSNPVVPLIDVVDLGGLNAAVFSTGDFATGPFISTLEQSFAVSSTEPVLSFDFSLPETTIDLTGTGSSLFSDALVVSVQDTVSKELLLVIWTGALPDPFGTAPGAVGIGPSTSPLLQYNLQADLSSLAGLDVTLFIDVINEDDGFISVFDPTLFKTRSSIIKAPDAAPTSFLLLMALSSLVLLQSHRRRNAL